MKRLTTSKKETKKSVKPGTHDASVKAVKNAPGFEEGNAIDVFYDVSINETTVIEYSERFFIANVNDPRVRAFEHHLDTIGIDTYEEYVGSKVRLTFLKQVKRGVAFVNIVDRVYVGALSKGGED